MPHFQHFFQICYMKFPIYTNPTVATLCNKNNMLIKVNKIKIWMNTPKKINKSAKSFSHGINFACSISQFLSFLPSFCIIILVPDLPSWEVRHINCCLLFSFCKWINPNNTSLHNSQLCMNIIFFNPPTSINKVRE